MYEDHTGPDGMNLDQFKREQSIPEVTSHLMALIELEKNITMSDANIETEEERKIISELIQNKENNTLSLLGSKSKSSQEDKSEPYYYYYYYYDQNGKKMDKPKLVRRNKVKQKVKNTADSPMTGSFANCTLDHATSTKPGSSKPFDTHPDSGMVVVSCREIWFRAPLREIEEGGIPIFVGVLSGAGGKGPMHRDSIRSTWARNRKGVYFLVAGPWSQVEDEFNEHRDLIWINEEEIYEGENSVLPFKTTSFLSILETYSRDGELGYEYLFKTDDDSYVDLDKLDNVLRKKNSNSPIDYWGCCTMKNYAPLREESLKWHVTYKMYPEELYPLYCQGAGFATSRKFVKCAYEGNHIRNFRYNPFEDVSIGFLAERCGIKPVSDTVQVSQYRADEGHEKMKASESAAMYSALPKASMIGKVVQHRVKTHYDMYQHHLCTKNGC
eukprot:CAMPEP_0184859920 /NCGR_PEP_ID=MMETSP0580-20130426/4872_1 /TAXON_ID=1118495 /ORGANISM="Dactyliosolen fragilissimus" /LENGTH=440 /DNA_ID=CAMNT_0027356803 /DNA_START=171 /DNA_END=1493 /DNA_ORIENTATION=+